MEIFPSSEYDRMFSRLNKVQQATVREALELFREDPHHDSLRNHALKKPLSPARSITIESDLRILFVERGWHAEVVLLRVGTHDEVYR